MIEVNFPVYSVCPISGNKFLVSGGGGITCDSGVPNGFKIFSLEEGNIKIISEHEMEDVVSCSSSSNGYFAIAVGSKIKLYESEKIEKEVAVFDTKMKKLLFNTINFDKQGTKIVIVDGDGVLRLLSVPELKEIGVCKDITFKKACFYNDELIIGATTDNLVVLKADESLNVVTKSNDIKLDPRGLIVVNEQILYSALQSKLRQSTLFEFKFVKDENKLGLVKELKPTHGIINTMANDEQTLTLATSNGDILTLNLPTLKRKKLSREVHRLPITTCAVHPKFIISSGLDSTIMITPNTKDKISPFFLVGVIVLLLSIILFFNYTH